MRPGSDPSWRPVERIDSVLVAGRGLWVLRGVHWWSSCHPSVTSLSLRRLPRRRLDFVGAPGQPGATDVVTDPGLRWIVDDDERGLQAALLQRRVTVTVPSATRSAIVGRRSRRFRWVLVTESTGSDASNGSLPSLGIGRFPGVYTRWPAIAESDHDGGGELRSTRLATRPAALFRDVEDRPLVG